MELTNEWAHFSAFCKIRYKGQFEHNYFQMIMLLLKKYGCLFVPFFFLSGTSFWNSIEGS